LGARAAGATTILNAAPANAAVADFLPLCDFVVMNEIELGLMSGQSVSDAADVSDLLGAMRAVRRSSGGVIVTTRGRSGLVCLGPEGVVELTGHEVPVVDSTGAGDCFIGSLAAGLVIDRDLTRALAVSNLAAAISVQRPGAGNSMPTRAEVLELLEMSPRGI
jgi:ribokinase